MIRFIAVYGLAIVSRREMFRENSVVKCKCREKDWVVNARSGDLAGA